MLYRGCTELCRGYMVILEEGNGGQWSNGKTVRNSGQMGCMIAEANMLRNNT